MQQAGCKILAYRLWPLGLSLPMPAQCFPPPCQTRVCCDSVGLIHSLCLTGICWRVLLSCHVLTVGFALYLSLSLPVFPVFSRCPPLLLCLSRWPSAQEEARAWHLRLGESVLKHAGVKLDFQCVCCHLKILKKTTLLVVEWEDQFWWDFNENHVKYSCPAVGQQGHIIHLVWESYLFIVSCLLFAFIKFWVSWMSLCASFPSSNIGRKFFLKSSFFGLWYTTRGSSALFEIVGASDNKTISTISTPERSWKDSRIMLWHIILEDAGDNYQGQNRAKSRQPCRLQHGFVQWLYPKSPLGGSAGQTLSHTLSVAARVLMCLCWLMLPWWADGVQCD